MARTTITKIAAPGGYAAGGTILTDTAADVANGNDVVMSGNDLLIARNSGASPYTITIESAADQYGRTKNITAESIAAGATRIYGPFPTHGWAQGGRLNINGSNASVLLNVISLT